MAMIPEGKVIPMSEVDQLRSEVRRLELENANQEMQLIELTLALMTLRRPMVLAHLKELQGEKHGPSGN